MQLFRRIQENRSIVTLVILVLLCLISLASGTQSNLISRSIRTSISLVATPFWTAFRIASDSASYAISFTMSHHAIHREAEALREQLTESRLQTAALEELIAENRRLRHMLGFQESQTRLTLMPALVKVKVTGWLEATLIIDKGSVHGVQRSMCVVTPDGIVGIVSEVQPFNSFVYTLHHAECRIGAMIQRTRAFGIVRGSGSNYSHICRMEYLSTQHDVGIGDKVVSVGSGLFPRGLPIGTVISAPAGDNTLFRTAYIEPAANPYKLDEVWLVTHELISPEELSGDAPVHEIEHPGGHPMPDHRSIQEQYAP